MVGKIVLDLFCMEGGRATKEGRGDDAGTLLGPFREVCT